MDGNEDLKSLVVVLNEDRKDYLLLSELLRQQRVLLIERRGRALMAMNLRLMEIYGQLNDRTQRRLQLFSLLGLPASSIGFEGVLLQVAPQHHVSLRALWQQLAHHANSCKILNERNGVLLRMQQAILAPLLQQESEELYYR